MRCCYYEICLLEVNGAPPSHLVQPPGKTEHKLVSLQLYSAFQSLLSLFLRDHAIWVVSLIALYWLNGQSNNWSVGSSPVLPPAYISSVWCTVCELARWEFSAQGSIAWQTSLLFVLRWKGKVSKRLSARDIGLSGIYFALSIQNYVPLFWSILIVEVI